EPQPDLLVFPPGDYRAENPTRALLVVEVSETTLAYDRGAKSALYAEAGVPEYWIVDLVDGVVEVRDQPAGFRFGRARTYRRGDSVAPAAFPDLQVEVSKILP